MSVIANIIRGTADHIRQNLDHDSIASLYSEEQIADITDLLAHMDRVVRDLNAAQDALTTTPPTFEAWESIALMARKVFEAKGDVK
jgi:hypothetical protein